MIDGNAFNNQHTLRSHSLIIPEIISNQITHQMYVFVYT